MVVLILLVGIMGIPDLGFERPLDFEKVDDESEVIITMQVGQGGSAPPKPYTTTIKKILKTTSQS
jgi:hypothetical protein